MPDDESVNSKALAFYYRFITKMSFSISFVAFTCKWYLKTLMSEKNLEVDDDFKQKFKNLVVTLRNFKSQK